MKNKVWTVCAGMVAIAAAGFGSLTAGASPAEVKAKPPMYTYVAYWTVPRARWAEFEKSGAATGKVMDKAIADGTLAGYGADTTLIHTEDGSTHDTWWSGMSMAAVLNVLDELYKAGTATSPALAAATKHWDGLYESRYYNWRPGTYKAAYARYALYVLKPDAPDDAVETMSKSFLVPLFEKLLADGTIFEYEIDTQAVHSESPGHFYVDLLCATADGMDKIDAALTEAIKDDPLAGPAFGSMVDFTQHRDELVRTDATYK